MTREDKIRMLEAIKNGVPSKYALLKQPVFLYRNKGETDWHIDETGKGMIISEEDRAKYLHKAICVENVSKEFQYKW